MAKKVTRKQYLDWMAHEPRTSKWGAYVAYDRDKCNHLLLQEYIDKVDRNSYMPPIDGAFLTGETTWKAVKDYLTDWPRLSFENNPDGSGGNVAEANMRMAVVGGTSMELFDNNDSTVLISLSSDDPLVHPELKANRVALKDIQGQVNNGQVVLDLGDAGSQRYVWELTGSRIEHVRRVGGAFMKRKFREAEPERRKFILGRLAYTDQDFLKPESFKLRTVMEEGANAKGALNFGNGALEIRIAMKGKPEGGFPGEDWKYPIPSDDPKVNASLIVSNELLFSEILERSILRQIGSGSATFEKVTNAKGFIELKANSNFQGGVTVPEWEIPDNGNHSISFGEIEIPFYSSQDERLTVLGHDDGTVKISFGLPEQNFPMVIHTNVNPLYPDGVVKINLIASYKFEVDVELQKILVAVSDFDIGLDIWSKSNNAMWGPYFEAVMRNTNLPRVLRASIKQVTDSLLDDIDTIDAFVLNSLLFNSTDAVRLQTVDTPGDLVSFGSISPRLTTFAIDPQEKLLGYGSKHTFTVYPETGPVKWSVSDLDGSSEGAGKIDENTGEYTAPGLDQISGAFKRVKITATGAGSSGKPHVSKALVTIAAQAVTLNPLIQTCPASGAEPQTREFSANAMNGAIKWSVIGSGTIPETAKPDLTNVYTAPPKDTELKDRTFTIDEVKVTTTQHTKSSYVVVTHAIQTLALTVKFDGLPAGKAQFSATFNGQQLPVPPVWKCFPEKGAGDIDADGLYTADPNSSHQFVVITCSALIAGSFFLGDAFSIQPLPLGPLPAKPKPEIPQLGSDGMPDV